MALQREGWGSDKKGERLKKEEGGSARWARQRQQQVIEGWERDEESVEQGRVHGWMGACENDRGGGCYRQLTGNLFLPFSLNKGCDWLHGVWGQIACMRRTNPLKGWFTVKSQQQQDATLLPMNQADRQREICCCTFFNMSAEHEAALNEKATFRWEEKAAVVISQAERHKGWGGSLLHHRTRM